MGIRRYRRSNKQAIPRRNLQARQVTQGLDPRGFSKQETYVDFELKSCTVQPAQGDQLETLGEGYKGLEAYNIFTNTPIKTAVEGTNSKPDEVFLTSDDVSTEGWYIVAKVNPWTVGVIPHYHLIVVRKNNQNQYGGAP